MRRGDAADPLLRQVLPLAVERDEGPAGYSIDPVGDLSAKQSHGVLRKYAGRALVIVTGACAVHCRYCFRRHFPYGDIHAGEGFWRETVNVIGRDPSVDEVILSGGDPLAVSTRQLSSLIHALGALSTVTRLRIHTRLPIVLPARIDPALLEALTATRLRVIVVVHANHANEVDQEVRDALAALRGAGIVLFNQSVLLRRVNDDAKTLASLSEALFDAGVIPYYLHLLDRVHGAAHFEVDVETARQLHRDLRTLLPGYLVPRLVREDAGAPAKTPVY